MGRLRLLGGDAVTASIVPRTSTNEYGAELTSEILQVIDESELPVSEEESEAEAPVAGRYTISYKIKNFGVYDISLKINGEHVRGSPGVLQIGRRLPPVQDTAIFSGTATKLTMNFQDSSGSSIRTNRGGLFGLDSCEKVVRGFHSDKAG